ncbi:hypothetical protein [Desertivirga xinjiangensis]|uniref:hypothetical protein n=1 Tax=Desertivirga xinjiangensis TaxID=539206 RepID=UPI00210ED1C7|nr:hypothetical protein [Pedobacter xinjiangensis]
MKLKILIVSGLSISSLHAQTNPGALNQKYRDSIKASYLEEAAIRSPAFRPVSISTSLFGAGIMSGKLGENEVYKGDANLVETSIGLKFPVASWGKNTVVANVKYQHQRMEFVEEETASMGLDPSLISFSKGAVGVGAMYTRSDSLFGKKVVYLASISGLTNNISYLRKMSYMAGASFILKQNQNTNFTIGLVVNIDPSSPIPAFPLISYWHRFGYSKLELSADPSRVSLRKMMKKDLWASFGTSISGSTFFFEQKFQAIPEDVNYSSSDVKTGAGLEYRLFRKFMVGVEGGLAIPMDARAFEAGKTTRDYFFNNERTTRPYLNLSVSLLRL